MDAHEDTAGSQVLLVSDTGRRRRWTDDEKVRIVDESHRAGVTLAEVARRYEISWSMLNNWRYRHKFGLLGCPSPFMRLVPMESGPRPDVVSPLPAPQPQVMTLNLASAIASQSLQISTWKLPRVCSTVWFASR